VGVLLFWPLATLPPTYQLAATLALFSVAVPAAGYLARRLDAKDPGRVVVDEIVGAWVSLLLVPWNAPLVAAAFVLFRVMDVLKPQPARRFEALPGGWGIVLHDVMAGVYANVLLRVGLLRCPTS
jgi:phosphatidylglycerophosphatase A